MSWGQLIAPQNAAPYAQGVAVRDWAAPRAPQPKRGAPPNRRYKGRGLPAFAILAIVSGTNSAQAQPVVLAPVQIHAAAQPCVDVQVEGARSLSYDCLNQQLKEDAQNRADTPPAVTAKDAAGTGAPTTVGTFSYTGTSIRMGNSFGHSAIAQRPPAPSFTNALVPTRAK
jgi:hypothetical protein